MYIKNTIEKHSGRWAANVVADLGAHVGGVVDNARVNVSCLVGDGA